MMFGQYKRGDIVTIVTQGDFGKPRPALVIQADQFSEHGSITVLPISSTLVAAPLLRVMAEPSEDNGLKKQSQIMIDKVTTVRREKIGFTVGHLDANALIEIERCLAVFLGIVK